MESRTPSPDLRPTASRSSASHSRTVLTWSQHVPALTYCAVVERTGGRSSTACRGSWPSVDDTNPAIVTHRANPPDGMRCNGCKSGLLERGLDELRDADAEDKAPVAEIGEGL